MESFLFENCFEMRRNLLSEDDYCSSHQDVFIHEEKGSLSCSMRVSTPETIYEKISKGSKINPVKEIVYDHKALCGIEKRSDILNNMIKIEKEI